MVQLVVQRDRRAGGPQAKETVQDKTQSGGLETTILVVTKRAAILFGKKIPLESLTLPRKHEKEFADPTHTCINPSTPFLMGINERFDNNKTWVMNIRQKSITYKYFDLNIKVQ